MREFKYKITREQTGMTVHNFARSVMKMSTHCLRTIKFKEDGIKINGSRVTTRAVLHEGDLIVFRMADEANERVVPVAGAIDILFENDDLVLINKEAGRVVHPCHGHYDDTLLNFLAWHYLELAQADKQTQLDEQAQLDDQVQAGGQAGTYQLRPIGRLDKDTSGLIFVAKNRYVTRYMELERQEGRLSRIYLALVEGWFEAEATEGLIDKPIQKKEDVLNCYEIRADGRPSKTHYKVKQMGLFEGKKYSLVELKLETGRTHQIRVHMAGVGHPLLGDPIYGTVGSFGFLRAALHSAQIICTLPEMAQEERFEAPLPDDFLSIV